MKLNNIIIIGLVIISLSACKKQDEFLDAKPNQALVVPTTLEDYESLIYNESSLNANDPTLGAAASEESHPNPDYPYINSTNRLVFTFSKEIYSSEKTYLDWNAPYNSILICNIVLDGLDKLQISETQQSKSRIIKGTALFFRAYNFYNLLQTYSKPYDPSTASTDLGIPLRLTSDFNIKSVRSTVKEGYDKVIADLKQSAEWLPLTPSIPTRPSKQAVNALLARIYLALGDYDDALIYANESLKINNSLTDYNSLQNQTNYPFSITLGFLQEDIFHTLMTGYGSLSGYTGIVNDELKDLYSTNDLRKRLFFNDFFGTIGFSGSYDWRGNLYSGLANDEIYLIRAECYARKGQTDLALQDLNSILIKRFKQGTFTNITATSSDDALKLVLLERRKELCFRGLRWTDLRRLNKEDRFKVTLTHVYDGATYTLPPNDPRYTFPIPDDEINLSGIPQNER